MPITVRDLQREQMAHTETKKLLEEAKAEVVRLKNLPAPEPKVVTEVVEVEKPIEVVRYIRTPDLTQVSEEELRRALGNGGQTS